MAKKRKARLTGAVAGLLVLACALPSFAGELDRKVLTVTVPATNYVAAQSATNAAIRGWIEAIHIDFVDSMTGYVSVVIDPDPAGMTNIYLVEQTNISADVTYRPRVDVTDSAGTALTGDPPARFGVVGGSIICTITNASGSNISFRAVIDVERGY